MAKGKGKMGEGTPYTTEKSNSGSAGRTTPGHHARVQKLINGAEAGDQGDPNGSRSGTKENGDGSGNVHNHPQWNHGKGYTSRLK